MIILGNGSQDESGCRVIVEGRAVKRKFAGVMVEGRAVKKGAELIMLIRVFLSVLSC